MTPGELDDELDAMQSEQDAARARRRRPPRRPMVPCTWKAETPRRTAQRANPPPLNLASLSGGSAAQRIRALFKPNPEDQDQEERPGKQARNKSDAVVFFSRLAVVLGIPLHRVAKCFGWNRRTFNRALKGKSYSHVPGQLTHNPDWRRK